MNVFDLRQYLFRIDQLRDHYALIIGAALIVTALAGLIGFYTLTRPPRIFTVCALAVVLGLGALLVMPEAPGIARAIQLLAKAAPPDGGAGPYHAASLSAALPPIAGDGPPIIAYIWYPKEKESAEPRGGLDACGQSTGDHPLPRTKARFPLILYAPGDSGSGRDGALTSATLASHGYVVIGIDDVDHDPRPPNAAGDEEYARPLKFDFSSDEAFEKTLRGADRKVRLEAEKALAAAGRLEACASAEWRDRLQFGRIGFFGFSFGGAVAAEAGVMDKKIAAVVNLDGWLFGRAASGALDKPYMVMNSDVPIPDAQQAQSPNAAVRNEARLSHRDVREQVRLVSRPDGYWLWVKGSTHTSYSDQLLGQRSVKSLMSSVARDPLRMKEIRDSYLLAFFDEYLKGEPRPLLRQSPSPFSEVELLKDSLPRFNDIISAPREGLL